MNYQLINEYNAHQGPVYTLCDGPKKGEFYSGGSDQKVLLWNTEGEDRPKLVAQSPTTILSLLFIKEFGLLCIGQAEGGVHILNIEEKLEVKYLKQHQGYIFDMLFIPEKKELVVVSGDGSFSIWSVPHFKLLFHKKCSSKKIRTLAYSSARKEMAMGLGDGRILFWNSLDWELIKELGDFRSGINILRYLSHDTRLLAGEKDAYLTEINLANWAQADSIPAHNWAIYDLIDFPEQDQFVTASRDKTIKIWDAQNLKVIKRLEGFKDKAHTHSVNKLLKVCNGFSFLSTGDDGKIKLWKEVE